LSDKPAKVIIKYVDKGGGETKPDPVIKPDDNQQKPDNQQDQKPDDTQPDQEEEQPKPKEPTEEEKA